MFVGVEIKGARRWISLPGLSLQPSEFLKPCFAIVAAWLIAEGRRSGFPGTLIAGAIFVIIALLLKSQPDIGMTAVITAVFFAQLYINGLNLIMVGMGVAAICGGAFGAYVLFPHVQRRVHEFLHPARRRHLPGDTALEAFGNGGLFGRGPGEGSVKDVLPDAHADFVFAVAGEEFGLILCLIISCVFGFIVVRGLLRLLKEPDLFSVLACTGLLVGFGLQAFINMASSLELIPTKGMTLPFVSYGGSSVLAVALGMGMLLALTRRRHHGRYHEGPRSQPVVIAAGGTGGHFFPAEALAAELIRRGRRIALMTDARSGASTSKTFADHEHFVLRGAGIAGRGAWRADRGGCARRGTAQARTILGRIGPAAMVGFGGYPAVAPVLGARLLHPRPPVVLHEQNAVLGRANRFLARHADLLAVSFESTSRVPASCRRRSPATRSAPHPSPRRCAVRRAGRPHPPARPRRPLGARVFSEVIPPAVALLSPQLLARLDITQQCRPEDLDRVRATYAAAGIEAELSSFFPDMPERLAAAHLVIAPRRRLHHRRAGGRRAPGAARSVARRDRRPPDRQRRRARRCRRRPVDPAERFHPHHRSADTGRLAR